MDEENNEEIFSFEDAASQVSTNAVEQDKSFVQNIEMATQLDISCGTQERFTPVKQPRFGKCKRCTTLKVEMKREQAKVKRLESARKNDKKR